MAMLLHFFYFKKMQINLHISKEYANFAAVKE